jgi:hypothetical protein
MSRLRILVLRPDCNLEAVMVSFVTHSHEATLLQLLDVASAVRSYSENEVVR